MVQLPGASAVVREAFRPWGADLAAVVTRFGGATLLLFALSVWFWVGDRRKIATVVSYAFVVLSLVLVLKTAFDVPRPPASVQLVTVERDPHAFPSGHAAAAAIVYGSLAAVYDRLDRRGITAVATAVALVALSRVVLGVHYLGDVIAGVVLGVGALAVLWRVLGQRPRLAFGAAVCCSGVALVLGTPERALAFGGSLGGLAGTSVLDRLPTPRSTVERVGLVVIGVPILGVGTDLLETLHTLPLAVAGNAAVVGAVFALPLLVGVLPLGRVQRGLASGSD